MKKIDELLIKAQHMVKGCRELIFAMIFSEGGSWAAEAHLWDGTEGHAPTIERSIWPTMDTAVEHILEIEKEYPNSRDVPIIVDDL